MKITDALLGVIAILLMVIAISTYNIADEPRELRYEEMTSEEKNTFALTGRRPIR